jgi:hypothetical protein
MAVYAAKDPTWLYGDKTRTNAHENYRIRLSARLEVVRDYPGDRFYEVTFDPADVVFEYPQPYDWSFVRYEDVSLVPPEPEPEPEPEPGEEPSDAEVGRVIKYLFGV